MPDDRIRIDIKAIREKISLDVQHLIPGWRHEGDEVLPVRLVNPASGAMVFRCVEGFCHQEWPVGVNVGATIVEILEHIVINHGTVIHGG